MTEDKSAPADEQTSPIKQRQRRTLRPATAPNTTAEKIRVELNIEKWPGIWQPAKGHTRLAPRTLERQVELESGRATSKLVIGFTELGTLTTEDQRMFYALIRQWENAGKPVGRPVYFSDRLLSRHLRKRGWGTNVIEAITGSLRRLRMTPLRWIKSFHKADEPGTEYEEEIPFQMLDDLKIVTRRAHGHVTNQQGYFQFNRHIETNLAGNYTKPLLEEVFFRLQSEIAQLLYTHIDLVMFGKTRYERCTKELFADLGLTGASYRYRSNRKQKLERALAELEGVRLNHGVLKSATIVETADGQDYKVVFLKGTSRQPAEAEVELLPDMDSVVINHYAKEKDPATLQAEELVRHFHNIFHGITEHEPQLREMRQAITLVSRHGLETAKGIVEFAAREAKRTNFSPRNFGAVLNYVSAAVSQARTSNAPVRPSAPQPTVAEPAPKTFTRGEARLLTLTAEQLADRLESAKRDLFRENVFLAGRQQTGAALVERMVRSYLLRQLEAEPMELLPLSALRLPDALAKILAAGEHQNLQTNP